MEGASYARHACLRVLSVVVVVGVLAGCHHGGEGVKDVSTSGSATGAGASRSPDDLPLWEQPELLAKYPVRAKKNPDGSYDYSDPKFENADLCKDLPPHYWEKRGYKVSGSQQSKRATLKDCSLTDGTESFDEGASVSTDKRIRKNVGGKLFKQYYPGRFDQVIMNLWPPLCSAYIETSIGRIGFSYANDEENLSENELCERAHRFLEKVGR